MITQCFDWQDTFTECIVFPNSFIQNCLISMWTRGWGLISNFVCLWPLCTHWDLCSIFICLHIYNLQVTLDIMNTWFCCLLSFIKFILSSENLNPQWSWSSSPIRKMSIIQNFKEDSWPFVLIHLVSQVYGGRLMLRVVFSLSLGPWDLSFSSPSASHWRQFESQSQSESQHPGWPGPVTGGPVLTSETEGSKRSRYQH